MRREVPKVLFMDVRGRRERHASCGHCCLGNLRPVFSGHNYWAATLKENMQHPKNDEGIQRGAWTWRCRYERQSGEGIEMSR